MGIWFGNDYFGYCYDYLFEYVYVMKEFWMKGECIFDGKYFQMNDCKMKLMLVNKIEIVVVGQSLCGMEFVVEYVDYNFVMGVGINMLIVYKEGNVCFVEVFVKIGCDVGVYVFFMVIVDEMDELVKVKWEKYCVGVDVDVFVWMVDQGSKDVLVDSFLIVKYINLLEGVVNFNMGMIVGFYVFVVCMLDEVVSVLGMKGIMLIFDDFLIGFDQFGQCIQFFMVLCSVISIVVE